MLSIGNRRHLVSDAILSRLCRKIPFNFNNEEVRWKTSNKLTNRCRKHRPKSQTTLFTSSLLWPQQQFHYFYQLRLFAYWQPLTIPLTMPQTAVRTLSLRSCLHNHAANSRSTTFCCQRRPTKPRLTLSGVFCPVSQTARHCNDCLVRRT